MYIEYIENTKYLCFFVQGPIKLLPQTKNQHSTIKKYVIHLIFHNRRNNKKSPSVFCKPHAYNYCSIYSFLRRLRAGNTHIVSSLDEH